MYSARIVVYLTVTIGGLLLADCRTVELVGAGASFPSAVYTQWINLYRRHRVKHVDVHMEYDSVGSTKGKTRIKGNQVHYAGSDTRLTAEEKMAYPDLNIIPTMAGAIVMAFNIPDLKHLNLNLEAVVGIYNGTIKRWNDTVIANLNPASILPVKDIVVVARAGKSGTTGAFTSCLSAYSTEWKTTYGTFTEGRDEETRQPVKWNNDTIKFFGKTNLGMSTLILSVDYSIGYVAVADAHSSKTYYATIINDAGNLLNATVQTVQNAIISANGSSDIVNTPGEFAYPLASFTYFIIKMTTMEDCDAAIELVRYIKWCYFSVQAQEAAIRLYMVPLDNATATDIVNNVLKNITCRGQNVWETMLEMIEKENKTVNNTKWQIPTLLSLCLVVALLTGSVVHLGRQHIILHRELLKETWKIDCAKISLDIERSADKTNTGSHSCASSHRDDISEGIVFADKIWADNRISVGAFNENPITLLRMHKQPFEFSMAEKKTLIRMRENIKHPNVMQLLGITRLNGYWSKVHAGLIRGSLSDILQSKRIEINTDGIIALSKSLTKGLMYLHKKGIVHGHLNGMCCFIDASWEVRIADWIETQLESTAKMDRNKVSVFPLEMVQDFRMDLWAAPEIIKFKRMPTQSSDVYSLSMIFQEMFTRQEPYSELSMTHSEIIHAILTCGIRPKFAAETPVLFRSIIEQSWETDPAARPKTDTIYNSIKAVFPANISFLDCMIRSIELYAKQLEGKVKGNNRIEVLSDKEARY